MTTEIPFMSATELLNRYRRRALSPREVVEALIEHIEMYNPAINAFVTKTFDTAIAAAESAAGRYATEPVESLPRLLGVPITVKDLTNTAGVRTTYGSLHFKDHVATFDDPIWARLHTAGAVLLGKSTTPEFGGHTITESPLTGTTNNPWDLTRTTGGSSGGAGAALAAGFGPLAVGSDGGGSIRVPASFCGVVGLKASMGRIPRGSEASRFESVGAVGPMSRTVLDNALMLTAVAGPHYREPYSLLEGGADFTALPNASDLSGIRIAVSPDLGNPPIQPEVYDAILDAAEVFQRELGAEVDQVPMELPDPMDYFIRWWLPIVAVEVDDLLAQVDDPTLTHPLILESIDRCRGMTALDFVRTSLEERGRIHEAFAEVFQRYDLLIWATTPTTAYAHPGPDGGPIVVAGRTVAEPAFDNQRLTEAIAHAGYPAISIPCGFDHDGLPIGLQIAGRHGADACVLTAALAFEQARPWAQHRPALTR